MAGRCRLVKVDALGLVEGAGLVDLLQQLVVLLLLVLERQDTDPQPRQRVGAEGDEPPPGEERQDVVVEFLGRRDDADVEGKVHCSQSSEDEESVGGLGHVGGGMDKVLSKLKFSAARRDATQ